MFKIYSFVFIALFACGCAVSSVKDFEPLIKEAIAQEPIKRNELGFKDYSDKDSAEFYDTPQVKILALLKTYQKEHFRFNESLEKFAKNKTQKDFVEHYKKAQRNILLDMLAGYYGNEPEKRISYDEFVNATNSFFDEQGQFITDFGEYFFIVLDKMDDESVCKEDSCGHGTEMFNLLDIYVNLKEQNKLNDRVKNAFYYGRKGFNDYISIKSARNALSLWREKLNAKNLLATKPSKKQMDDFIEAFDLDDAPTNLEKFMDYWSSIYLRRLYIAKYGIEIALDSKKIKSLININPHICLYDIFFDKNAAKFCENNYSMQVMRTRFIANVAKAKEKFYAFYDDKMCAIVDFGVLYDERLVDVFTFTLPKIITNPNNKSIMCNGVKEALGGFKTR